MMQHKATHDSKRFHLRNLRRRQICFSQVERFKAAEQALVQLAAEIRDRWGTCT